MPAPSDERGDDYEGVFDASTPADERVDEYEGVSDPSTPADERGDEYEESLICVYNEYPWPGA